MGILWRHLRQAAAEAMAMQEGLALANCLGCSNVIMESNSTKTIEACTGA
jgi:hypothetical protein